MTQVLAGTARLHSALGVVVRDADHIEVELDIGDLYVARVYIGPSPRFGRYTVTAPRYVVVAPGAPSPTVNMQYALSVTPNPNVIFVEVCVLTRVDVTPALAASLLRPTAGASVPLPAEFESRSALIRDLLDIVAGTVALRVHRQLAQDRLHEFSVVERTPPKANGLPAVSMQFLERINLGTAEASAVRNAVTRAAGIPSSTISRAARAMRWLLRAWGERDDVYKFLALFIPLELSLPEGVVRSPTLEDVEIRALLDRQRAGWLRRTLFPSAAHALETRRTQLVERYNHLVARALTPTLNDRFGELAASAALPGWEEDVRAFRQFNGMRNGLLHRGVTDLTLDVQLTEDVVRSLRDLVERYVSVSLFGDEATYRSSFRGSHQHASYATR